jgi:hypothetical protein
MILNSSFGALRSSTMTSCRVGSEKGGIPLLKQNFRSSPIWLETMDECGLNAYICIRETLSPKAAETDAVD